MDKAITGYGTVVGALVDLLAPRGEDVLRKAFRENAQRVYACGGLAPVRQAARTRLDR